MKKVTYTLSVSLQDSYGVSEVFTKEFDDNASEDHIKLVIGVHSIEWSNKQVKTNTTINKTVIIGENTTVKMAEDILDHMEAQLNLQERQKEEVEKLMERIEQEDKPKDSLTDIYHKWTQS